MAVAAKQKRAPEPATRRHAPETEHENLEAEPGQPDHLDGMTVPELVALIRRATELKDQKIGTAREAFLARTREEAAQLGLTLNDLVPRSTSTPARHRRGTGERRPAAVKFKGPNGETWTGRGRQPTWLTALEGEGHKRDEYLVDKGLPGV